MTENIYQKWFKITQSLFDMTVQEEIGTGRRPLKKYPEIFLTPGDLAEIFESFDGIIPKERWKDVFMRVRDFARDQNRESGMKFSRVRCKTALTGWARKAVISEINEEVKLKRNSSYAQKTSPVAPRPNQTTDKRDTKPEPINPEGLKKIKSLLDEKFPHRNKRGLNSIG